MPESDGVVKYIFTEKMLKKMLDAPPPGFKFEPKLVPVDQKGQPAAKNSENKTVHAGS